MKKCSSLVLISILSSQSHAFINYFRNGIVCRRSITLSSINRTNRLMMSTSSGNGEEVSVDSRTSVTGTIYDFGSVGDHPTVQLYTKDGCTLCDKTKDVLKLLREEQPHSLEAIDITDPDKSEFFDRYKWDIPVLHINGMYWTKHKLTAKEAIDALVKARSGNFEAERGEPNALKMEKKMAERQAKSK